MNCLGEFFAFQYLSICDLLYLAEISHRKKIVLCLESGPTWHTMWKLLTPSPQLENKLWHFLRYFSKICPKKLNGQVGQSSMIMPPLKCPLLTVQRLVFKLVRFYLCRNNKRRKINKSRRRKIKRRPNKKKNVPRKVGYLTISSSNYIHYI